MTRHPAVYSDIILRVIGDVLTNTVKPGARVLDPFGGVGRIHELRPVFRTFAVEIEEEWAEMGRHRGPTLTGDATNLPRGWTAMFDGVATSCTYGNRMADKHDDQSRCRNCKGTGKTYTFSGHWSLPARCIPCEGTGRREWKRITYKHSLGRDLNSRNTGGMQWGEKYKGMHILAWAETWRVLRPGGVFILNVSNHIREGDEVDVSGWHCEVIQKQGFRYETTIPVKTRRMKFGANRDTRTDSEFVHVFIKPNEEMAA